MVCKKCEEEKVPGTRNMVPKEVEGSTVVYACESGHQVVAHVEAYEKLDPIPLRICPSCAQEEKISQMTLTDFEHIGEAWHDVKQRYYYTCLECGSEHCETVHMVSGNKLRSRRTKNIGLTPIVIEPKEEKVLEAVVVDPPKKPMAMPRAKV